jgi:hypothetical protein
MNFIDFVQFVKTQCMHETIYEDSDGNLILVTRMLDAYAMANKMVAAEREACAKVCEEGEFMTFGCAAEAIRARGQA